jgi:anti-sigma B factor antagonist
MRMTMSNATTNNLGDLIAGVRRTGDAVVIGVRGEVDLHNSPALRTEILKQLADPGVRRLVLNLAAVPYMDSSGIAVFVEALQKLRRVGGKVCLTDLQPRVRGLLEIARLDTIFALCPDEDTAVR